MDQAKKKRERRARAHRRIRNRVSGTPDRPRLAVFKSSKYIYAQLVDDSVGHTLAQATSLEASVLERAEGSAKSRAAGADHRTEVSV